MNSYKILIISLLSILFLSSCEDVIELDLENTDPQLVIEGTLDMTAQTARVVISQTSDFYDSAQPVPVENATAELTSESGNSYSLIEIETGIFELRNLNVSPEERYTLTLEVNGKRYVAETHAPFPANLLELDKQEFTAPFGDDDEPSFQVFSNWQDQVDVENFYRIRAYRNNELLAANYMVINDELLDGNSFRLPVRQETFEVGEAVQIELLSTDEAYYNYFIKLFDLSRGGGTPFNPKGNFDNGALGCFGIYSTSRLEIEL